MGATRAGVGGLPVVMRPLHHGALVASPDNAEHHHNDDIEEETTMLDTEKLQEIAQEMAETQKAMEQSGDATPIWTSAEIARQDLLDSWTEDAGAWGLDPEDTETRDQLWDMVIEAYYAVDPEKDPIGAVVLYIRGHMAGLVRHDLDAKNNGWDPYEDPESGYVWQEAERQLLAAIGDEELDDDTYDALCEATWGLLLDDGEEE